LPFSEICISNLHPLYKIIYNYSVENSQQNNQTKIFEDFPKPSFHEKAFLKTGFVNALIPQRLGGGMDGAGGGKAVEGRWLRVES
jgi:hypothetical protein